MLSGDLFNGLFLGWTLVKLGDWTLHWIPGMVVLLLLYNLLDVISTVYLRLQGWVDEDDSDPGAY